MPGLRRLALLAVLLFAGCAAAGAPVPLDPDDPGRAGVGQLVYRGGLVLGDADGRLGGLSDIAIAADGAAALVLSDDGGWWSLALRYDEGGDLAGAEIAANGRLTGIAGRPLRDKRDADSEGLAVLADGSLVVSFEQRHRLLRFPPAEPPFSAPPLALATPPGLAGAPANGGVEALAALPDGRLLAVAERLSAGPGQAAAWVGGGRSWVPLAYPLQGGFLPTGAALLPDGDLVVLERSFSLLGGFAARLVRLPAASIEEGRLRTEEIAVLRPPLTVDNMEGVAARRGPDGETLLYLVSDNNFLPLQRSLLLMFELRR